LVRGVSEGEGPVPYHKLTAPCVVCKRTMLPYGRSVCYRCAGTLPGLPRPTDDDDDDRRPPRPGRVDPSVPRPVASKPE
jgi:hypothetical protein